MGGPPATEGASGGVKAIQEEDVPVVFIMHTEVEYIDACSCVLKPNRDGLIVVCAHSGKFAQPNWFFIAVISAEGYASAANSWLQQGVQVVGGSCGIGVEHMQVLRKALTNSNAVRCSLIEYL